MRRGQRLGAEGRARAFHTAPKPTALAALLAAALSAALLSCGGKPPEIAAVEWRIELRPSAAGPYESLSAFASIKDEDGSEDISSLWIVDDEDFLAWPLTDADWTRRKEGADEWLGAAGLARQDFGPMPRGDYRFVAIDAAGERVERSFRVAGAFPDLPAPELAFEGGTVRVRTSWPETLVLGYDGTGALAGQVAWIGSPESLADLFGPELGARIVEAAAYGYDPSRRMGAYSAKRKTR